MKQKVIPNLKTVLLRCILNCKILVPIEVVISAKNLRVAAGQGKIYIRPIQRPLSVILLKSETSFSISVLKEKYVYYLKEFPLQSLRANVLTCLWLSYL